MKFDMRKGDLTWPQYVWALLPFGLVAVGGAIGGLCGGAAAGVNVSLMKGQRNASQKYLISGLATATAVVMYFVFATLFVALVGLNNT